MARPVLRSGSTSTGAGPCNSWPSSARLRSSSLLARRSSSSAASTASPKTRTIPPSSTGRSPPCARPRSRGTRPRAPSALDDPATVKAGARAYATIGCVDCHGGPPDNDWAKWSEGLKPVPADLKVMAKERTAGTLLGHQDGIKMTGMPSFGLAGVSDQQIWTIVAFIKSQPVMSNTD